ARDLRRATVDLSRLRLEAVRRELDRVRAVRVRLDDLGARAYVLAVDARDEVGVGQVELVERLVDVHAARVQHRAHRTVDDVGSIALDQLSEVSHGNPSVDSM